MQSEGAGSMHMNFTTLDTAYILIVLLIMLASAHAMGFLFQRLKQPVVVGEILAGIILGPTVIGHFFPEVSATLFGNNTITKTVLAALSQLGLIFLMFASGLEIRTLFKKDEFSTSIYISTIGCILPFAAGALYLHFFDQSANYGPAANSTAFLIIFCSSIAVTSIPVISRIFIDLGLIETKFARTVLSSAILEDIALYVVMGIALGLVSQQADHGAPILSALGLHFDSVGLFIYHFIIHVTFVLFSLMGAPKIFIALSRSRWNLVARKSPVGYLLVTLFIVTVQGAMFGISLMFSAFCAGFIISSSGELFASDSALMKKNAFGLSIPIYFCMVGYKLDLLRHFHVAEFLALFVFACTAKALSVYAAARIAKEGHRKSVHLAICMNARGGPGIVLASVAMQAQIINDSFYVSLVLLALFTSMGAGSWLERALGKGEKFT